jgi:hypothetical protein
MLDLYCPASVYTGCAVTPCNALFKASWRSPDIDIRVGSLPEEVGGFVGTFICEKPPAFSALANAKRWRCSSTWFSQCHHLQDCLGASEKFAFELNKFSKGIKDDLKTIRSEAQNRRNRWLLLKKVSPKPL